MPVPVGLSSTWGAESWSETLIEALSLESVLLQAGARRVVATGRTIHVPRLLVAPDADWVPELTEIPSDAGDADSVELVPRKIGNILELSRESIEDASVNELDAVGRAMVRGVATKLDAKFFSVDPATATAPAGIRAVALPGVAGAVDFTSIVTGIGAITAEGGNPNAVFVAAADLTALRLLTAADGRPPPPRRRGGGAHPARRGGAEPPAGGRLFPAPLPAGTAVIADMNYIVLAVRRDASVDFSSDSAFTRDAIAARVTMRLDWAVGDPAATYVIT